MQGFNKIDLSHNDQVDQLLVKYLVCLIDCHRQRCQAFKALGVTDVAPTPFILGITGSVSVGKSSFAHHIQLLLQAKLPALQVELVNTDGFLKTTALLESEGLLQRKGFPDRKSVV